VNTAVLRAAASLAPSGTEILLYTGLGNLPAFNPDLDNDAPPDVVTMFRREIELADGLLISSLLGRSLDAMEIVADPSLAAPLRGALEAFVEAISK
jgi:hypothetical protein